MRSDSGDDQRPSSVLYSRGTGGQFAEEAEQGGCGFLIGEVFQRHGSREMRRGRVEADADEILVAPVGERVDYVAQFYQIGRASCRERVEMSAVAGSLK